MICSSATSRRRNEEPGERPVRQKRPAGSGARKAVRGEWGRGTRLLLAVAGWAIYLALLLLKWTTRWRLEGGEWLLGGGADADRVVYAFWHDRLVMMPLLVGFRPGVCVMNSRHRDGEIITRAIERLGIQVVRGSSTRGWSGGLRGMLGAGEQGLDLAMVVDGPRGPRHVAKKGAVALAQATGRQVVPISYAASRALRLRSWDRLIIPFPLSRVVFIAGAPIVVDDRASAAEKDRATELLGLELRRITRRAEEILGHERLD